jgi:DinB superfamily
MLRALGGDIRISTGGWKGQIMNANEVLIDFVEDNRRRLLRMLDGISNECLVWRPEPDANNMLVTIWHMGRIFDVFLTQQAKGMGSEEECWFRGEWAKQTGYDPRGRGLNGWGMITGYTQEDVAAMPQMTRDQVLGYLNEVFDAVRDYLASTPEENLLTPAPGFEGKYSKYQCIQMPLLDNVRHLGEVFAIKARWERQDKPG